ncbi:MAG TPA: isoprenylcysteine carboxylmethyltransferase family protein [Terracidiphilus sp.]|nr:isoprenylcysteine carboxylmethyltransferase family protein [Terracidiphilus sp.]
MCVAYDASNTTEMSDMSVTAEMAVRSAWELTGAVWLVGLLFSKRTVRRRLGGGLMVLLAAVTMAAGMAALYWRWPEGMGRRLVAGSGELAWTAAAVTVAGCAFAVWARLTLGRNWSGQPTVKAGHELMTRGPYALVRHPIYSGLLMGIAGTVLLADQWGSVLGMVVAVVVLHLKIRQEEMLMMETFPEAYPAYRARVKALIPGVY